MSVVDDVRWIADELRRRGEKVVEIPGWETRGAGPMPAVDGWVNHYDAIRSTGPAVGLRVVTFGRADLRNSLSMFYVDLAATIYVVAAGISWHAGSGTLANNTRWAGVEIQNANLGAPMPPGQRHAVLTLNRVARARWGYPVRNVIDHKEHTARKSDRNGVDSSAWRDEVGQVDEDDSPLLEEDDMPAPTAVTNSLPRSDGKGEWLLQYDGGVITVDLDGDLDISGPFFGSYPGLPPEARQGERGFYVIRPYRGGYVLVATDRSRYHFPAPA